MEFFLGLDNGGSITKAAIFDIDGNEMCVSSISTSMITPKPGFVERNMDEMWEANCSVIKEVLRKSRINPSDIKAIGICGHGKGLYLLGEDKHPIRNGIASTDTRAYRYPIKWRNCGIEKKLFTITFQHIMACQPIALLAWLRDNEPDTYLRIRYIFECKDYIRFRLTGIARAELTDYSGANLVNLHTRLYDNRILALLGLDDLHDCLPPLCESTEICGSVSAEAAAITGLSAGTPVIGGMFDIDACAIGSGVIDESRICMIAGTWSINEYIKTKPVLDGSVCMNSLFCIPGYYLIEESSPTSAGNNEWFIRNLLPEFIRDSEVAGRNLYEALDEWVDSIAVDEFVPVFLPFILASNVHPNARGTFVGIGANHNRHHLIRSIYEGVAFCHRYHFERLMASRSVYPRCIRLAGGAAHSDVWSQMFADVMDVSVETVSANETGALGCAIAGAYASGSYGSISEAVDNMCKISNRFIPDKDRVKIYDKKYKLYLKAIGCLDGLWSDMQKLVESSAKQEE